jgi:hypothetical protein
MDNITLRNIKKHAKRMEGVAIGICGYLYMAASVGCAIDEGHFNGEFGERLSKKDAVETMLWGLEHAVKQSNPDTWRLVYALGFPIEVEKKKLDQLKDKQNVR